MFQTPQDPKNPPNPWNDRTKWIWPAGGCAFDQHEVALFRRAFRVRGPRARLVVRVSADTRYRLYLNGERVSLGPCKGDEWAQHYETVDLSRRLRRGRNVLAAEVVHFGRHQPFRCGTDGPTSEVRCVAGGFLLDGVVREAGGRAGDDVSTGPDWRAVREPARQFISARDALYAGCWEHIDGRRLRHGWAGLPFDDADWGAAEVVADSEKTSSPMADFGQPNGWILTPRPIPPLFEKPRRFKRIVRAHDPKAEADAAGLICGDGEWTIPAGRAAHVELDAAELTTGYLNLCVRGGRGRRIRLIYSEAYERSGESRQLSAWVSLPVKERRDDVSGVLRGETDEIRPGGGDETYQTFHWRTFRFLRLEVTAGRQPLTLRRLDYDETGYPLKIVGRFTSSDPDHRRLWSVSVRTLRRCMHETFEDCPYYEQLQYVMDTRLQALFGYQISADDRLARRAIDDFHRGLTPDGLIQARHPTQVKLIIPGFALHWMFMLEDHLAHFGDRALIARYRPTIDAILGWFDRRLTPEGLVGPTGRWSFVDWVAEWDMLSTPSAARHGPMTVYNEMYVCALRSAAALNEATGRTAMADEYRARAESVARALRRHCWDGRRRLFTDGPGVAEFSQHAQVWAVLAGVVRGRRATALMRRMLSEAVSTPERRALASVSYAMAFYLFRALETAGLYDRTEPLWDTWRDLLKLNLTTWVEDPVTQRSDCHGWGALPLYEFPASLLGVRPGGIGYDPIIIEPRPLDALTHAEGTAATPHGSVRVAWRRDGDGRLTIEGAAPEGRRVEVRCPDGRVAVLPRGGAFSL